MCRSIAAVICMILAVSGGYGQTNDSLSFEVASVKPAALSAPRIGCSGGPGTSDPVILKCANVPLAFRINYRYGFAPYQFPRNHPCCQEGFHISAKVSEGATQEQFRRMLQNLLAARFKLAFHYDGKEMAAYQLTCRRQGSENEKTGAGCRADSARFLGDGFRHNRQRWVSGVSAGRRRSGWNE